MSGTQDHRAGRVRDIAAGRRHGIASEHLILACADASIAGRRGVGHIERAVAAETGIEGEAEDALLTAAARIDRGERRRQHLAILHDADVIAALDDEHASAGARIAIGCANVVDASGQRTSCRFAGTIADTINGAAAASPNTIPIQCLARIAYFRSVSRSLSSTSGAGFAVTPLGPA